MTSRYADNHPHVSRPLGVARGGFDVVSDDAWDYYLAAVFGDVATLQNC